MREFIDLSKLKTTNKSSSIHFALSAPLKKSTDINFARYNPPSPKGISGGGVWKIEIDPYTGLARTANLVGIGIEYLKGQNAFIGTKIHLAIYALLKLREFLKNDIST